MLFATAKNRRLLNAQTWLNLSLPVPVIAMGAPRENDAGPDAAQRGMLDAQAWALQRWRAAGVDAVLATADDAQATAWEQALRAAMAAHQVSVATVSRIRDGEARLQLALPSD